MAYCPVCALWAHDPDKTTGICKQTVCEGCGYEQCMSYGTGRGACHICRYGHLKGWSKGLSSLGSYKCGYSGCSNDAVFFDVPRVKRCCGNTACTNRVKITRYDTTHPGRKYTVTLTQHMEEIRKRLEVLRA